MKAERVLVVPQPPPPANIVVTMSVREAEQLRAALLAVRPIHYEGPLSELNLVLFKAGVQAIT